MKTKIQKDYKIRQEFFNAELILKVLRKIQFHQKAPLNIRFEASKKLYELESKKFSSRIQNYCVFSGRSRAVYRLFKMSRIFFRQQASEGKLYGVKKSIW